MKANKAIRVVGCMLILVNLAILTKYILFKRPADTIHVLKNVEKYPRPSFKHGQRENWVLFASIHKIYYSRMDDMYKFMNIGGNILGFVPLGFLLPLVFFRRGRLVLTVGTIFLISFLFESVQRYTGLGVFDVDDLLLNTVGGLLGYIFYLLMPPFQRRKENAVMAIG
ncbi:VanZ family protein [Terrimonas sp. NA20]|uniref:VanZ family protein n=1 Tax=Terrimonas ginsenosidimutans TaxID=2908004 RepID=A0ABS9L0K1_9BACT|nr:VanZ family protein [Terrimonas ginsenosidimutans]MCG2618145.1 VanZ family protein [Terrimonas ginsenosidimutans]